MNKMIATNNIDESAIAIIGISGRFPKANTIDTFWKNLQEGVESIDFFSEQELLEEGIDPSLLKKQNLDIKYKSEFKSFIRFSLITNYYSNYI